DTEKWSSPSRRSGFGATQDAGCGTGEASGPLAAAERLSAAEAASSRWRIAAPLAAPSYETAVRFPDPVISSARALPLRHPGRPTISWITGERSGVRCSVPACPAVQGRIAGHDTAAWVPVPSLAVKLPLPVVNAAALSAASPRIERVVASDCDSSAWNCT